MGEVAGARFRAPAIFLFVPNRTHLVLAGAILNLLTVVQHATFKDVYLGLFAQI